ncbi:MAG: amino acid-binding protein [Deltaproteobacteria bacterium]|nr:amino acid-binding protein [Deltaproteobacteria bacterium]
MEIVKQLAVFVANKPGTLAAICGNLSDREISIQGLAVDDARDHAVLRLIVDDAAKAIHVLGESGVLVLDSEIIKVTLPNKPGNMADLARVLSEAGVNIEYAYGGLSPEDKAGILYLKVTDMEKAQHALAEMGL